MTQNGKWTADDIPNQDGRVAIVTGSSSGIGFETARQLAAKGATVILAVRNQAKGDRTVEAIRAEMPCADVQVMLLDLASLKSVRMFAEAFVSRHHRLDLLINNAGVMIPPYGKTEDGFELQFGTNHLGHFALTGLLIDLLESTPGSRIVNVSSMAHIRGNIDFDDLDWANRRYRPQRAYGDSKIANLYFTYELARRLRGKDGQPMVTAAHPGWTATDLQRHSVAIRALNQLIAHSIGMGALPTLRAACDESAEAGQFYGPEGRFHIRGYPIVHESNGQSHDEAVAKRLWEVSEQLTGVSFGVSFGLI